MRVRVIGAGVMGAASADALARRGVHVEVCEAAARAQGADGPRDTASSYDASKVLRAAYGPHTERYGPLVLAAIDGWRRLEADEARPLLHATGALVLRPAGSRSSFTADSIEALARLGVHGTRLDRRRGSARFPSLAWEDVEDAFFDPTGGWLAATEATQALLRRAVRHGATVRSGTPCVRHEDGRIAPPDAPAGDVDVTLVAAGPWVRQLVDAPATPTRQHVAWFRPTRPGLADLPVWLYDLDGEGWYGFPVHPDGGVKIGLHRWAAPCDPDVDRTPDADFLDAARAFVARALPGLDPDAPATARVCLYTNAPAGDLALYWDTPRRDVLVTGLGSGHGFKFGPAWGERVADVLLGAEPPAWADPRCAAAGRHVY
jgi:glycine/D-amino acid oxidase-like deaminating enzyme